MPFAVPTLVTECVISASTRTATSSTLRFRATVRFLQASMLDPRLLEGSPPYDVMFCRNLLIYLAPPARACVMASIDRLLAADGLLFIGHADRLDWPARRQNSRPTGDPACFAYRRAARGDASPASTSARDTAAAPSLITPGCARQRIVTDPAGRATARCRREPPSSGNAGCLVPGCQ